MKFLNHNIILAGFAIMAGCARPQPSLVSAAVPPTAIAIYVDGPVIKPGMLELNPPLTIEHAIKQAGGIHPLESDWVHSARVERRDGHKDRVRRKSWSKFVLQDGDRLHIPRE